MEKFISIILFSLLVNISLAQTTYSKQLESRASNGDANAQENLGWCFHTGSGIDKDFEKAFYWYKKAAESGKSYSMYNIGIMYQNGQTDKKDEYEAAKWF
ncbi:MAG: sel1 repeat family protein, partial [Muribaculum sp.]|nr:sel1 repeat family protein [Muribaculum sp.]